MGQPVAQPGQQKNLHPVNFQAAREPEPQAPIYQHKPAAPTMKPKLEALPAEALAMGSIAGKTMQIDPLTGNPALFVYQRTGKAFANHASATHPRLQLRRETGGKKGKTPAMEAHRAVFADGVQAYKSMTPTDRAAVLAEQQAANYRGNLYAYFMGRWMHLHSMPPPPP